MRILVTGGAGFIGSHLVERLVQEHEVVVLDNFSLGKREFLQSLSDHPHLSVMEGDLLELECVDRAIKTCDAVMHLAANSDIREGTQVPDLDLKQGTLATFHVLEAMRQSGVKKLLFASSSVVYGLARRIPTPEDHGPLLPISLYGASKLAAEGLISAYSHLYGIQSWVFRFANVVGARMTHGVLYDFLGKLEEDPTRLEILGDGNQRKAYLHVEDCVDGMLFAFARAHEAVNVLNLSPGDSVSVQQIARMLVERLGLTGVAFHYTGSPQGWRGDVPCMGLETTKMTALGWKPKLNSEQAVTSAIEALLPCRL